MPLGTEIRLGPGDIVLDEDQLPPWKGAQQPPPLFGPCRFGPCLLWQKQSPISATAELLLWHALHKLYWIIPCSVFRMLTVIASWRGMCSVYSDSKYCGCGLNLSVTRTIAVYCCRSLIACQPCASPNVRMLCYWTSSLTWYGLATSIFCGFCCLSDLLAETYKILVSSERASCYYCSSNAPYLSPWVTEKTTHKDPFWKKCPIIPQRCSLSVWWFDLFMSLGNALQWQRNIANADIIVMIVYASVY